MTSSRNALYSQALERKICMGGSAAVLCIRQTRRRCVGHTYTHLLNVCRASNLTALSLEIVVAGSVVTCSKSLPPGIEWVAMLAGIPPASVPGRGHVWPGGDAWVIRCTPPLPFSPRAQGCCVWLPVGTTHLVDIRAVPQCPDKEDFDGLPQIQEGVPQLQTASTHLSRSSTSKALVR